MWVSPFRYPRIIKYLLLPVAFRSLSRLSSALSAKASTLRSYQLNLLTSGAGCSLSLRLQRQTLRSWFITLASSLSLMKSDIKGFLLCHLLFWMSLSFIDLDLYIRFSRYRFGNRSVVLQNIRNETHKCFAFISSRASHYVLTKPATLTSKLDTLTFLLKRIAHCLVEMVRFELMTPCLQGRCSPN